MKLSSYEEFNQWKAALMRRIAEASTMDELLLTLNQASVRYLLVGGQAVRLMEMPRATLILD